MFFTGSLTMFGSLFMSLIFAWGKPTIHDPKPPVPTTLSVAVGGTDAAPRASRGGSGRPGTGTTWRWRVGWVMHQLLTPSTSWTWVAWTWSRRPVDVGYGSLATPRQDDHGM